MRDLPKWVPQASRPFSWGETWDAMSENERRWSGIMDAVILVGGLSFIFFIWGA